MSILRALLKGLRRDGLGSFRRFGMAAYTPSPGKFMNLTRSIARESASNPQPMNTSLNNINRLLALTLLSLLSLNTAPAHAAKTGATVTPKSLKAHGFSMRVKNRTDGTVEFTVVRDLSKARQFPPGSGLQVSRYATLRVSDKSGLRAECSLEPDTREKGMAKYRFTIAGDCVAQSSLQIAEDDDYQDQTREHLIGGGTHYGFSLGAFAGQHAP